MGQTATTGILANKTWLATHCPRPHALLNLIIVYVQKGMRLTIVVLFVERRAHIYTFIRSHQAPNVHY